MAGRHRAGLGLVVCALLGTAAASAQAGFVPLPRPAPLRKTFDVAQSDVRTTGSVPVAQPGRQAAANSPRIADNKQTPAIPNPLSSLLQALPGQTTAFDSNQRALVEKVNAYMSGIRTMVGDFVQVGPDGKRTEGELYLQKPGRVRFDYDAPSPIELIADGQSVVVRDRKLATQDVYPLSQTPLRFLLADHLDLMRDTNLVSVSADDVFITLVIEEKQVVGGTHRLMLMFGAKDYALKQWTVTDPQGYDTTVAVYNLDTKKKPDPNLFKIDYTRYPN